MLAMLLMVLYVVLCVKLTIYTVEKGETDVLHDEQKVRNQYEKVAFRNRFGGTEGKTMPPAHLTQGL